MLLAQSELITLGSDPKTWIVLIGGTLISMIVGRFIQAFRNGAGIKDAVLAVWLGTNTPKNPPQQ
jgi:hypothetical protein